MDYQLRELRMPSPGTGGTLAVLADAMGDGIVPASRRLMASDDGRSPEEGLTLLEAYLSIREPGVRQAILDTILTISGTAPRR